jgi:hypothetical protein
VAERWARAWRFAHDSLSHLGKAAAEVTSIGGRTTNESRTAELDSDAEYPKRRSGVQPIKGESGAQRLRCTAAQIQARAEVTGRLRAKWEAGL